MSVFEAALAAPLVNLVHRRCGTLFPVGDSYGTTIHTYEGSTPWYRSCYWQASAQTGMRLDEAVQT
jgi:hypothetical protein